MMKKIAQLLGMHCTYLNQMKEKDQRKKEKLLRVKIGMNIYIARYARNGENILQ